MMGCVRFICGGMGWGDLKGGKQFQTVSKLRARLTGLHWASLGLAGVDGRSRQLFQKKQREDGTDGTSSRDQLRLLGSGCPRA